MSSQKSESKRTIELAPESSPTRGSFVDTVDPELEKRVLRKLDLNILPLIMLMQLISFLDRSNIGNAKVHGLVDDLRLKGSDFNGKTSCVPQQESGDTIEGGNQMRNGVSRLKPISLQWLLLYFMSPISSSRSHTTSCSNALELPASVSSTTRLKHPEL